MRAMWIVSKGMKSKKHMKSHVDSQAESQGKFDGVRRKAVCPSLGRQLVGMREDMWIVRRGIERSTWSHMDSHG